MPGSFEDVADELVPGHRARVREMERPRSTFRGEGAQRRREVGSEGGAAALVIDEGEWRVAGCEAQDELHHVVAVFAADPRGARH